ncbi:S-layer homology domain-containing protein [Paenibacillus sp. MER 99-2]|uniref:S-layer homology domain-containing protein n=1 Tax=Paenibacillus sp. MER 99-2 TaxID=2939572 RepID=UPI0020409437|nr:S-layer homology domain-containing protein [Paenibacillus sp. MER 99-2]MCM3174891.1 S-layer homology domain-containing protein [Paenibacillus sp. MER 99-2]
MALKKMTAALLVFLLLTTSLGVIHAHAASPTITGLNLPVVKTYKAGEKLDFTVVFTENVNVTGGRPYLKLNIDGTVREAFYAPVSSPSQYLQFSYTVQPGDNDTDGIQVVDSIQLNGASITNNTAEPVVLGNGFGPSDTSVLDTGIKIDTIIPSIVSVSYPPDKTYTTGEPLLFTVVFSENISVNTLKGKPYLSLKIGETEVRAEADQYTSNGSNQIVFQYIVEDGLQDLDGITIDSELKLYGGTIEDAAHNSINPLLPYGADEVRSGIQVITSEPSIITVIPADGYYREGDILKFDFIYDPNVTVNVTGEPYLPLSFETLESPTARQATFAEVVGNRVTFTYTVQSGDQAKNGIRVGNTIELNSGTIDDSSGPTPLPITVKKLALADVVVDAVLPKVQHFFATPTNRNYVTGEQIEYRLRFTEPIRVSGTPSLSLMSGSRSVAQAVYVSDVSGLEPTDLVFRYTVQDTDRDVVIDAVGLLDSTNGTIVDNGGNISQSDTAYPQFVKMILNASAPTITLVEVPAAKTYNVGDELLFKVHFSEVIRARISPAILPITIGSNTVNAMYAGGTSTNILTFKYVVQASDLTTNGITLGNSLLPNGGALISRDSEIQADLTLNNVGNTSGIIIGQAPPQALHVNITGTPRVGSTLTGSYTYSDANSDEEGVSLFKWFRSDNALGANKTAISRATSSSYTLQAADLGKYISFEVTPVAQTGTTVGSAVESVLTSAVTVTPVNVPTPPVNVPASPANIPESPTNTPALPTTSTSVDVLVNGKVERAGTATTSKVNGQTVITVTVDQKKLEDKLTAEGLGATVIIPVNAESDIVIGELNGQMIQNMESKQAILEIRTNQAAYTIPAQQINIGSISNQIGNSIALKDIKVRIEIAKPTTDTAQMAEDVADKGNFKIVVPPIEFTVKAIYEDKTIVVSKFNAYVERTIAIPDGVDPQMITTGVVVEADESVRHVPTKIVLIDGKYYAKVNSLTNSTYLIIWNPIEFSDVANHWAKETINDLGSRMVIDGKGEGSFDPDSDITRAEFVDILVRGLGLRLENEAAPFLDLKASDWHNGSINSAYSYHLINGLKDGSFHPNAKITRQEAMVITAKAMKITQLVANSGQSIDTILSPYADAAKVSSWAQSGIADVIQTGIVTGKSGTTLAPNDYMTRAEAATIIKRLLQKSDLI